MSRKLNSVLHVIFHRPGEAEISLLTELAARGAAACSVIDPDSDAAGAARAAELGMLVASGPAAIGAPRGSILVDCDGEMPAELAAEADLRGWRTARPSELPGLLDVAAPAERPPASSEAADFESVLAEVERSLDRGAVLGRMLEAVMARTGASGGVLLMPRAGMVDFVAAASRGAAADLPRRVVPGDGDAGRALASRRVELARLGARPGERGPRPSWLLAAPVLSGRRTTGMFLLSGAPGGESPDSTAADFLAGVSHRCGAALRRLSRVAPIGARLRLLDLELRRAASVEEDPPRVLRAWARRLSTACDTRAVSIAMLRDDGTVLEASAAADDAESIASDHSAHLQRVIAGGGPLMVSEIGPGRNAPGADVFHLPVGESPLRGVLTLDVGGGCDSGALLDGCRPLLDLLADRLADLRASRRRRDRSDRLEALADILAGADGSGPPDRERILAEVQRLTGAVSILAVAAGREAADRSVMPEDPRWRDAVDRLLERCRPGGWRASVLDPGVGDRQGEDCLLAAVAGPGAEGCGMVLCGKRRLHSCDEAYFTALDGEMACRLCGALDSLAAGAPAGAAASASAETGGLGLDSRLETVLRREMDRCRRYHVSFSLSVFRPAAAGWDRAAAERAAIDIHGLIRSSDLVFVLDDGMLALLAPEETQSVSRLERRIVGMLRQLNRDPDLEVATGRMVYPGAPDDPAELLAAARAALGG